MVIIRAKESYFDSDQSIATGLRWQEVALGGIHMVDVDSEHLSILEDPGVHGVAAVFAKALACDG